MKNPFLKYVIIFSFILTLCGCNNKNADFSNINSGNTNKNEYTRDVFAMDTYMNIKIYSDNEDVLDKAEKEILRIENLLSRGCNDSEIHKINTNAECEISPETANLLNSALEICKLTDGSFDITIAPVMDLWGFYSKEFYVPTNSELLNELQKVDYSELKIIGNKVYNQELQQVDLGGIAKGFTSDSIIKLLKDNGVNSAIISLGGNVQSLGLKPDGSKWSVGIIDPLDNEAIAGAVNIENQAVITSGGYQRNFTENGITYHHIINPATGEPVNNGLSSVTIISENGTLADGLSTSLFVMGLEKGIEYWKSNDNFDVIFITDNGEIYITSGISDIFSSKRKFDIIYK